MSPLQYILFPFSLLYGFVMLVRNVLFDIGLLPSARFEKAVISVGNLSMGGTGKTPHIEYLIRILSPDHSLATLSRGYGRKSKGFVLALKSSDVTDIGDEALQIVSKFDNVRVAVDENRKRGITSLLSKFESLDTILLDDAFQHRYVKPGLSILLTSYSLLYSDDQVVPSGTLREFRSGADRADIIIVTKTPKIFSPISRRRILEDLNPADHQKVFFSYISYGNPVPLGINETAAFPARLVSILLLTGIADHSQLREHIERLTTDIVMMRFPDHHSFSEKDVAHIESRFSDIPTQKKVIITTEKDAMRLRTSELSPLLKHLPIYYFPIKIDFQGSDGELFDRQVSTFAARYKTSP